jgi:15-cis-phytoene synthase
MTATDPTVREAYAECRRLASRHYENFPVASRLVPREKRDALAAIYAFARYADDIADEPGQGDQPARLGALAEWRCKLNDCYAGKVEHPVFVALRDSIRQFRLSQEHFENLLRAFESDVRVSRHPNYESLLAYCTCSANPVGRLVLELFDYRDEELFLLSDKICTALQLTNFWQDVRIDFERDRIYLPLEDLKRFEYSLEDLRAQKADTRWSELMQFEIERTRELFEQGRALPEKVRPELRRQLRLTWLGGTEILSRIESAGYDVFRRRPSLGKGGFLRLYLRARAPIHPSRNGSGNSTTEAATIRHLRRRLTNARATNFYYSFVFLPREKREAIEAVYAFARRGDDLADGKLAPEQARSEIAKYRGLLDSCYSANGHGAAQAVDGARELSALAASVRRFKIPRQYFEDLIAGFEMDLAAGGGPVRYETFEDLAKYCYLVAGTIGLISIEVFGYRDPSARDYAQNLGTALQLVNILRDVQSDARRGRIYLPAEDLKRFGVAPAAIMAERYDDAFARLMQFESARAREYFAKARRNLAHGDRRSMVAGEIMAAIYWRILARIEARRHNVFGERVRLSRPRKFWTALSVFLGAEWHK